MVSDREHCKDMLARFEWPTQMFKGIEEIGEMIAAMARLEYARMIGIDTDGIQYQVLLESAAEEIADHLETLDQYVVRYKMESEVTIAREMKRARTKELYLNGKEPCSR